MPVPTEVMEYPFVAGLDGKTDKWVTQGLLTASNAVATKAGALEPAPGYDLLTSTAFGSSDPALAATRLARHGTELLGIGTAYAHTYSSQHDRWAYRGRMSGCTVSTRGAMAPGYDTIQQMSSATSNGITVHVVELETRNAVVAQVVDDATGAILVDQVELSSGGTVPRAVAISNLIHVFWVESSVIKRSTLDATATTYGFTAAATLGTTAATVDGIFSVCASATYVFVAYQNSAATDIYLDKFSSNLATLHASGTTAVTINCIAVTAIDGGMVYVAYGTTATPPLIRLWAYTTSGTTLTGVVGPVTVSTEPATTDYAMTIGVCHAGASGTSDAVVVWGTDTDSASLACHQTHRRLVTSAGSLSGYETTQNGVRLVGGPFLHSSRVYYVAAFFAFAGTALGDDDYTGAPVPRAYYLFDVEVDTSAQDKTDLPVAQFSVGTAISRAFNVGGRNAVSYPYKDAGATKWRIALPDERADGDVLMTHTFDFDDANLAQTARVSGSTIISGGLTTQYDGARVFEAGFLFDPWVQAVTDTDSGSTTVGFSDGAILIAATFAYRNTAGEFMRSAPFALHKHTVDGSGFAGNKTYPVPDVPSYWITQLQREENSYRPDVYVEIWTTADATTAGPLYLRSRVAVTPDTDTFVNPTAATMTPPTGDEEQLPFANDVELANEPPPHSASVCEWRDRVVVASGTDVWISKPRAEGFATAWSGFLRVPTDTRTGDITAVAAAGEQLLIFKKDHIHRLYGSAAAANGQGSALSDVELVSSGNGATNNRSICTLGAGVVFLSRSGLALVGRDGAVQPFGDAADTVLETYPVVRTAELLDGEERLMIGVQNSAGTAGDYLLFDVTRNLWTTAGIDDLTSTYAPESGVVIDGTHYYVDLNSVVHRRWATYEHGATSLMTMTIQTPWFKLNGQIGYWRARRLLLLGEVLSAHDIDITVEYDYVENDGSHVISLTAAQVAALLGADGGVELLRIKLPREPVVSIRFTIATTADTESGNQARFHALRLEYSREQSALRGPAPASVAAGGA